MADTRCSNRGATGLEPGFVLDGGEHAKGFARWVQGRLERGLLVARPAPARVVRHGAVLHN